jgi:excisionase family DNA binding protein
VEHKTVGQEDPAQKKGMNMKDGIQKRLLSVEETAVYLGLSPRTIYNGVHRKSKNPFPIKPKRIGKLVKFDRIALDKYIESL